MNFNYKSLALPAALSLVFSAGVMNAELTAKQMHEAQEYFAQQALIRQQAETSNALVASTNNLQAISKSLKNEAKYAGVSALCYGTALASFVFIVWPKKRTYCVGSLEFVDQVMKVCFGFPASIFVASKLNNFVHEYMDKKEKHKLANVFGFISAFSVANIVVAALD